MPATDYTDLYDFETSFETPAKALLVAAGIETVLVTRDQAAATTPRVTVNFRKTSFLKHWNQDREGTWRPDMFRGQMSFIVITDRTRNDDSHTTFRALIRDTFEDFKNAFTAENLPYYEVCEFYESGSTPQLQADNNQDFSTLTYDVVFGIKSDAWPYYPAEHLNGLRFEFPCLTNPISGICSAVPSDDSSVEMTGRPDVTYDVTLRIRGWVEVTDFTGGTAQGGIYVGGSVANATWNYYAIQVSEPAQTYFLNDKAQHNTGPNWSPNNTNSLDYEATIPIKTGATISLIARTQDNNQRANTGSVTVAGVTNLLPNRGQFLELTVVSAERQ